MTLKLTNEQLDLPIEGLSVQDAVIILQLIRKITKSGILEETELLPLGIARSRFAQAFQIATGINYDVGNQESVAQPIETATKPTETV